MPTHKKADGCLGPESRPFTSAPTHRRPWPPNRPATKTPGHLGQCGRCGRCVAVRGIVWRYLQNIPQPAAITLLFVLSTGYPQGKSMSYPQKTSAPGPVFPCATRVPLQPFPYRNGSQDTGRAQRPPGCCGRKGRMQVRIGTPGANGRAQGHEVLDFMARWGQGRSGCGWVFGSAVATGVRKDLWMRETRQRVDPSGRRQGGRKTVQGPRPSTWRLF
jgi:hypothetical protein